MPHLPIALQLRRAQRHLSSRDAALKRLIRVAGPCRLRPRRHHFRTLASAIISQQLATAAADTIKRRVIALYPGQTFPKPEQILATPDALLRGAGLSGNKLRAIRDLCEHVIDGRLDLHHLSRQSNEHIIEALVAVRGIGEWTAHMFLIFSLCRLDVLPTGDYGVRRGCQIALDLPAIPTPRELTAIAEERGWAPYRSVASWYFWRALE